MSEQQPEAQAPIDTGYMSLPPEVQRDLEAGQQPEAGAVCEHFYASHCYRGMSIRLVHDVPRARLGRPRGAAERCPRDGSDDTWSDDDA